MIQTVEMAFEFRKVGLASAMAVVLLLIVLLITWIQRRVVPDEKVRSDVKSAACSSAGSSTGSPRGLLATLLPLARRRGVASFKTHE